jgi:YVTN family beta-propeller protein
MKGMYYQFFAVLVILMTICIFSINYGIKVAHGNNFTIPVGITPVGIAYNSYNDDIYVANRGSHTVSVINGATDRVIAIILVGSGPYAVDYDADNKYIYVTNMDADTVSVINASNAVNNTIPVGNVPLSIAYNSDNRNLYVANFYSNNISVINSSYNKVVANISVDINPIAVAYNPHNDGIYVANRGSNTVSVINPTTNSVEHYVKVDAKPLGIAINPNKNMVYVTKEASNTISVINGTTNSVIDDKVIISPAERAVVNPKTNKVYVTNPLSGNVSVLDSKTNNEQTAQVIVNFTINPPHSGIIDCKELFKIPYNITYFRYDNISKLNCQAKPREPNFTFNYWSGSLVPELNSSNSSLSNVSLTQNGNLAANFKKAPLPSLPFHDKLFVIITELGIIIISIAVIGICFHKIKRRRL